VAFSESVPQVFFNTRLVGVVEETLQQLEKWDNDLKCKSPLKKYQAQITAAGEPKNVLALIPDGKAPQTTKYISKAASPGSKLASSPKSGSHFGLFHALSLSCT
jgi:hypothetical protein